MGYFVVFLVDLNPIFLEFLQKPNYLPEPELVQATLNFSEVLVSQVVLLERVCLGCGEMLESCQASHW